MKNKFDFTEGKWKYVCFGDDIQIQNGIHALAKVYYQPNEEHEANARLISYAPEMCKALVKYITFLKNKKYYDPLTIPTIKLIEKATGKKWEEIIKDVE
jgi:hypothetical protein